MWTRAREERMRWAEGQVGNLLEEDGRGWWCWEGWRGGIATMAAASYLSSYLAQALCWGLRRHYLIPWIGGPHCQCPQCTDQETEAGRFSQVTQLVRGRGTERGFLTEHQVSHCIKRGFS